MTNEKQFDKLDEIGKKALCYWLEHTDGVVTCSALQRGLKIGFARAMSIVESLVKLGFVDGETKKVLVTLDQLN